MTRFIAVIVSCLFTAACQQPPPCYDAACVAQRQAVLQAIMAQQRAQQQQPQQPVQFVPMKVPQQTSCISQSVGNTTYMNCNQ